LLVVGSLLSSDDALKAGLFCKKEKEVQVAFLKICAKEPDRIQTIDSINRFLNSEVDNRSHGLTRTSYFHVSFFGSRVFIGNQ